VTVDGARAGSSMAGRPLRDAGYARRQYQAKFRAPPLQALLWLRFSPQSDTSEPHEVGGASLTKGAVGDSGVSATTALGYVFVPLPRAAMDADWPGSQGSHAR
jgi:hypothetical protein